MNQHLPTAINTANGEFVRVNPSQIKVEAGMLGRRNAGDLGPLKSAIAWRERRQKGSGLLQPLLVSPLEGMDYYRLEDGLRRFMAIKELIEEGLDIPFIPVRILPAPLTPLERLILLSSGGKPLETLEQSELIEKLAAQGLAVETLAEVWGLTPEQIEHRRMLLKLSPAIKKAFAKGTISPEVVEGFWKARGAAIVTPEDVLAAEEYFGTTQSLGASITQIKAKPLGESLGAAAKEKATPAWMSKAFDPSYHYVSVSGLYEWMGGKNAVKKGYSKKVVDIVELMLHYCGGKTPLMEVAEALKKIK